MADTVKRSREKICNLFNRGDLEYLSGVEKPWLADTKHLRESVIERWPAEKIQEIVLTTLNRANNRG